MSDLFWFSDAQMARLEWDYIDQSQWFTMARCAGSLRPAQNAPQSLKAVERQGHLRSDDGGLGRRSLRKEDCDDPLSGHHYVMPCWAVDATYLKAHRTATSMGVKKGGVDA